MRIWLLGEFKVSVENRTIEEDAWRLKKAATLVKLLALSPSHHLHREQVMKELWPDLGTDVASNNLRGTVHTARDILEPNRVANSRYLDLQEQQLVLCPRKHLWVDIEAFEDAAATARRAKEPAAYRLAIELYAGELLPGDRYEEWAEGRREELRRLYLALLVELADRYEEGGEHEAAVEALRRVTTVDPIQEEAHAGLMRLYALSDELGTEPSALTRRLYDEIAAARFPSSEPAAPTVDAPAAAVGEPLETGKHNLPAPDRAADVRLQRRALLAGGDGQATVSGHGHRDAPRDAATLRHRGRLFGGGDPSHRE